MREKRVLNHEPVGHSWYSLVETLAWLHSLDPDAIGLAGFGKKTGFYARHCNTFARIEAQQSQVVDVKTGRRLGRAHAHYDEMVDFVRRNMKSDRYAIVHGDFKFDNVVSCPPASLEDFPSLPRWLLR